MQLLVGLGNPGKGYENNRHNIGFMAVGAIARRYSFSTWRGKFQGEVCAGHIDGQKTLALRPLTYMNESGRSVLACANFHKIAVEDILVIYDELDLEPGKIRFKSGGGSGGHNGIRSLDRHLGDGFRRLRLGIGHPGHKDRVTGHVLSDFGVSDRNWLDPLLASIATHLPVLLKGEHGKFMTLIANDRREAGEAFQGTSTNGI